MNNEEVIALIAFLVCSMIRVKFFEAKYTFYILFSVFLFLLLRTFILLSYDRWMERKIMKSQIEKIFEDSFEDINILSKIHSEKHVKKDLKPPRIIKYLKRMFGGYGNLENPRVSGNPGEMLEGF